MIWRSAAVSERKVSHFAKSIGVPRLIAQLLGRLDFEEPQEARAFLRPKLRHLDDPFSLTGLKDAVKRIRKAMEQKERIVIIGDYDVDGVTSTALLIHALNRFGILPEFTVPQRMNEGYGLSMAVVDRALANQPAGLVIAVDCGTNSVEEIQHIRSTGADVIIIDHHRRTCTEPISAILVNPHVNDGKDEPWKNLCSVGLAFKLVHGIVKSLREDGDRTANKIELKEYLDLVAMGTIADLVPLVGENRILAHRGLKVLELTRREGLHALFHVSGIEIGNPISPADISFKLGPRINASGRLANAEMAVNMLLSKNLPRCLDIAKELDSMNRERQEIERAIVYEADAYIGEFLQGASGFVLHRSDWHPGVVGIVASRLSRKHNVPTVVLGQEGELAKGSGRSVPGVNLVEVLGECGDLLYSWGGHPMATGLSLERRNVKAFQAAFDNAVKRAFDGDLFEPEIEIAAYIRPDDICPDLLNTVGQLNPFGAGNPEPVFGLRGIRLAQCPEPFGNDHFRFCLRARNGAYVSGVAWKKANHLPPADSDIDLAIKLNWNVFNGRRALQMDLQDWKLSS